MRSLFVLLVLCLLSVSLVNSVSAVGLSEYDDSSIMMESEATVDSELLAADSARAAMDADAELDAMVDEEQVSEAAEQEQEIEQMHAMIEESAHGPQACGAGVTAYLVPDGFMKPACETHDLCYGNCRGGSKATCDNAFKANMLRLCQGKSRFTQAICRAQANVYYLAVHRLGAIPFSRARAGKGCPVRR